MPGRLEVGLRVPHPEPSQVRRKEGAPFRILVLGDLSGRGSRGLAEPLAERRLLAADADTLEEVLERLAPRLELALPDGQRAELRFRSLQDFHPDALWTRLPLFEELRGLRRRLADPATAAAAAAEWRSRTEGKEEVRPELPGPPAPVETDADTLERLLGKPSAGPAQGEAPRSGVDLTRFLREVVAPQIVPAAGPHPSVHLRALDEAISRRMRGLLHHPAFQALEALWRSVHGLVTGLELGEDLQIFLLDATFGELTGDLLRGGSAAEDSAVHRHLVERYGPGAPDGRAWSVLVGDFAFGPEEEDVTLLAALGVLASRAGGPFLARALPALLGCTSPDQCADPRAWQPLSREASARWEAFRGSPSARWVGLALPRVLLRLPYGSATDEVEGFAFEECTPARDHEAYLWGSPAFACARLLAETFQESGWAITPGSRLEVTDLPAHTFAEGGEPRLQPCAEVLLPERAAAEMLSRGLMPILSYRNRNAVRLLRFQSLADPSAPLAGGWD